nr:uncharacterized protein LOC111775557 isoform X4 [Equus caballus]
MAQSQTSVRHSWNTARGAQPEEPAVCVRVRCTGKWQPAQGPWLGGDRRGAHIQGAREEDPGPQPKAHPPQSPRAPGPRATPVRSSRRPRRRCCRPLGAEPCVRRRFDPGGPAG